MTGYLPGSGALAFQRDASGKTITDHRAMGRLERKDSAEEQVLDADARTRLRGKDNTMSKKMLIDASVPDETRVVLAGDNGKILDVDFDNVERRQIKSNIYLARVTRVEPSLQAAFVDYGGNRHGFLPFSEIHPDYFQIPIADRERLMEEAREHRESKRRSKDKSDDEPAETKDSGKERRRSDKRSSRASDTRRRRRPSIAEEAAARDNDASSVDAKSSDASQVEGSQGTERLDIPVYQDDSEQPHVPLPVSPADLEATPEPEARASDATENGGDNAEDSPKGSMAMATRPEDLSDSLSADVQDGQIEAATHEQTADQDQDVDQQASNESEDSDSTDDKGEPNLAQELEQMIEPRGRTRRRPGAKSPRRSKSDAKRKATDEPEAEAIKANAADQSEDEAKTRNAGAMGDSAPADKQTAEDQTAEDQTAANQTHAPDVSTDPDEADDEDEALARAYRDDVDGDGDADDLDDEDDDDKDDAQDEVRLSHAFLARRYKIQEVIKRRQIMLIQINKEERGNKGAALTTYLSLPGRYCVLMPNTPKGGGISRKISNPRDRRKLKQILEELNLPTSLSVIVRTAGSKQDKPEIQRDYDYLLRTWDEIRKTTLESTAPALIYEEGNIIKRAVRDMYTTDCSEIVVEGKRGYDIARKMMGNLMPDQLDKVRLHDDSRQSVMQVHGVESKLEELHKPSVSLKSGGYLVINQTEALVAIDINSGKATRERSIEDTALKTNLEAADEIARQLRLRQMAGLVVIDFIDMEERKHNRQVEKRLRDALAGDRARIQVGQISSFGLLELSRQRLGPSLHEIYRSTCDHCGGLGHVRGSSAVVRAILRSLESAMRQQDEGETIALTCSTRLGMDLLNNYRRQLGELEERYGLRVEVRLNSEFHAEDFDIAGSSTDKPAPRARRRSDEQEAKDERRSRPSRTKDERPNKGRPEAREEDDDANDDEDEDSKARRRRGRRGGRKRRRSDEDGELDGNESLDASSDERNDEDEANERGGRNGRRGRGQRNGRRRDERRVFFARSFDELLNTDREPRDRRQRNQEPRGRRKREDQAPAFADSFDTLLDTDQELRERRSRSDRRRRDSDGPSEERSTGRDKRRNRRNDQPNAERQGELTGQEQAVQEQAVQEQALAQEASASEAANLAAEVSSEAIQASAAPVDQAADTGEVAAAAEPSEQDAAGASTVPDESATAATVEPEPSGPPKPKRKGWWSLGR